MRIKFYHDLSEPFDTASVEARVRADIGSDNPNILSVSVETSAMRGGDPVFIKETALDIWGQWNDWGGGYLHLSRS